MAGWVFDGPNSPQAVNSMLDGKWGDGFSGGLQYFGGAGYTMGGASQADEGYGGLGAGGWSGSSWSGTFYSPVTGWKLPWK